MIDKIISGGQTGADQAALDAAIKLGVEHGGWIPKGRLTEAGPLGKEYNLAEMPTAAYIDRTEKNVADSDGTLILSHGSLSGGSRATLQFARRQRKPCLHVDLIDKRLAYVAFEIFDWVQENRIRVLNVAGPRASKDPLIYEDTHYIVESLLLFSMVRAEAGTSLNEYTQKELLYAVLVPRNIEDAIDRLLQDLDGGQMEYIRSLDEHEVPYLHMQFGGFIRNNFHLWSGGNPELTEDCARAAGVEHIRPTEASELLVQILWDLLRQPDH